MSAPVQTETTLPPFDVKATLRIYAVVLSVGIFCGVAIVGVYEITKPIIARNKVAARQNAVLDVLPRATTSVAYQWDDAAESFRIASSDAEGDGLVFVGFDDAEKPVGVAIETKGMGYQDFIRVLYGYSPQEQAIIGVRVLESRETPGLGDRIEKDPVFLKNFEALDVSLAGDGKTLAHPIEFVKPGEKTEPWQIDGITGATISSKATADMLRESSQIWVPRVGTRLSTFTTTEEGED